MSVIEIDDELRARFQAVAAPEEDLTAFVAEATRARIVRREQREEMQRYLRTEIQVVKEGRRRTAEQFNKLRGSPAPLGAGMEAKSG